jgi:hypothetical protein
MRTLLERDHGSTCPLKTTQEKLRQQKLHALHQVWNHRGSVLS